jgi:hypothetical protein
MYSHPYRMADRFRNHIELCFRHGQMMIQGLEFNEIPCISWSGKHRILNLLVFFIGRSPFLAYHKLTRHLIYPSTPQSRQRNRYLSNRALIALMSIPELLRCLPLGINVAELSSGADVEGSRCICVG